MRAAQHRVAAATLTTEGSAVDVETLHAGVTPTLALYPSAAESVVERHLGLGGERLSIGCDLDEELAGYHLVWLPLADGVRIYSRLQGGRIALVGGYGRAALVEFGNPVATSPVWCSVGDVGLMSRLPAEVRERLVMEEHSRLLGAIRSGRAQVAVLGGADLQWAEGLPAARVVQEIKPQLDLEFLPLWGLFTSGRPPLVEGLQTEHLRLVSALDSTLEDWSKEEPA